MPQIQSPKPQAIPYAVLMLDRESCERRVYRLATLLTGDPRAAAGVISSVVDAQPDLRQLDGAHLDQLTVLRSREVPPRGLFRTTVPDAVTEALRQLPAQQREAWIFSRVYELSDREMAKAMDCSTSAIGLHRDAAEEAMDRWLGRGAPAAAKQVLDYSMSLDVPGFYRAQQKLRRRIRTAVIGSAIGLGTLILILLIVWLAGSKSHKQSPENSTRVASP